jgi:hypothetical protein
MTRGDQLALIEQGRFVRYLAAVKSGDAIRIKRALAQWKRSAEDLHAWTQRRIRYLRRCHGDISADDFRKTVLLAELREHHRQQRN